jgi:hypothetical protein
LDWWEIPDLVKEREGCKSDGSEILEMAKFLEAVPANLGLVI